MNCATNNCPDQADFMGYCQDCVAQMTPDEADSYADMIECMEVDRGQDE